MALIDLTQEKQRRGFSPTPYRNAKGYLVVGYGTSYKNGDIFLTEAEAERRLREDMGRHEEA